MPDRFELIQKLYLAARALPESQRAAFVRAQSADPAVVSDVLRMLATDASEFLQSPPVELHFPQIAHGLPTNASEPGPHSITDQFASTAGKTPLPQKIGAYEIRTQVGEGGMGVVYKAEQTTPIRRVVALKVIKLGMDTEEVIARFEAERQALALMDHPGIAKVFEAGATEAGRPYFAMEFVSGEPITAYCDRHNLTTKHRLELFMQVCDAVQHAHTKGVIHRDLKPSNVLVTVPKGENTPAIKIIDFGVAKATTARLTEKAVFTEFGRLIGTPEYMSPEQAEMNALDIDTRSDVYSLGVLLYELLSGATPFDSRTLRSAAYGEIQRIIREFDPPRLSTRLSAMGEKASDVARKRQAALQNLQSELSGELEWIPRKAMRKNRIERYETARDLARDVQNYLAGMPLLAGPETAAYRVKKWAARHRKPLTIFGSAAAIATAAVLGSLVVVTHQRNLARSARDEANANYQLARRSVNDYFLAVSQNQLLRRRGLDPLRKELIERAAVYHREFVRLRGSDPTARADLAMSLNLLSTLGSDSGNIAAAMEDIKNAVSLQRAICAEKPGEVDCQLRLAQFLINLAQLTASSQLIEAAKPIFDEAITKLRSLNGTQVRDDIRAELANALHSWATALADAGNHQAARPLHEEALAVRQKLVDDHPDNSRFLSELATTLHDIGVFSYDQDSARATTFFERALTHRQTLAHRTDAGTDQLVQLADTANWLAMARLKSNQVAQANIDNQIAISALAKIVSEPSHLSDSYRGGIFETLSWAKLLANDAAGAAMAAERGIGFDAANPTLRINLAHALALQGRESLAVEQYRLALAGKASGGIDAAEQMQDDLDLLRAAGVDVARISAPYEQAKLR